MLDEVKAKGKKLYDELRGEPQAEPGDDSAALEPQENPT